MALEIERKFLVDAEKLSEIQLTDGEKISQGYLSTDVEKIVRVRIKKNRGFLAVKTRNIGIVRREFEYEIPLADAEELLKLCGKNILNKIRYKIEFENHLWEVDIFEGRHAGLILVEVEINSADEVIKIPSWVGEEVSADPKYYNVNLIFDEKTFPEKNFLTHDKQKS
ncbi:MAG: CYTH domain-containing protein [Selenomonadaceae bacterium]|nr:CYTH domain-containing protein [Selenomonadaceae bacterium]